MRIPESIFLLLIMLLSLGPPLIKNRILQICSGVMLVAVCFAVILGFVDLA